MCPSDVAHKHEFKDKREGWHRSRKPTVHITADNQF